MKIRIVNPDYGVGEEAMARRCKFLQRYVGPDVELSMVCLTQTRVEIDSASDVVLAGRNPAPGPPGRAGGLSGCGAVLFSDPVLEACREQLTIPVIGGAQASMLLFPALARNVSVILADPARIGEKEAFGNPGCGPASHRQGSQPSISGENPSGTTGRKPTGNCWPQAEN